jgi:hypothetical protein
MAANFLLAILIAIFAVACLVQPNSKATVSSQSSQSSSQICASGVPTPNSDLVQFTVKVTDSSGKSITGLSEDSFRVTQSCQQMPLEFFEVSPPASIGLVIDSSGSMVGKLDQVRASGSQFIGGVNVRLRSRSSDPGAALSGHVCQIVYCWRFPILASRSTMHLIRLLPR